MTGRVVKMESAGADEGFARLPDGFASNAAVTSTKMFGSVALKAGGKVFAMLAGNQLVVKLPKARVDQLIQTGVGHRFDPGHWKVMKEWVSVSSGPADWRALAEEAFRFVIGSGHGRKAG